MGDTSKHAMARSVVVDHIARVADEIICLRLSTSDGRALQRWSPGSHIDVECGSPEITRQYSLCSDPADGNVMQIAVLKESQSRGGSDWMHKNVKVGDRLKIRGPRNHFRLDESVSRMIFIAGGIGITPISAMARRAAVLGIPYEIHYSGRRRTAMAFVEELAKLHGERLHVYANDEGRRNDFAVLLAQPVLGAKIYACGPVQMLSALENACISWPANTLQVEHFVTTKKTLDPAVEREFEVELKDSGVTLVVPADRTLLQVLRNANIDVQSDCEEGLCGSCEVRVLSGQIDHRDVVLTRAERETHSRIMTCCSRARTGKIVLSL